jgi:UTP--glucose-1-phosphate uridylyltransferase
MANLRTSRISAETAETTLSDWLQRMAGELPEQEGAKFLQDMRGFSHLFSGFVRSGTRTIDWSKIQPPPQGVVIPHAELGRCDESSISTLLNKLVVLKLNGGLGTTMGCTGPKSVIEVHSGRSFLDLTVRQIEHLNTTFGCSVPLVLMNSFNTDEETEEVISKYSKHEVRVECFNQHRYGIFFTITKTDDQRQTQRERDRVREESELESCFIIVTSQCATQSGCCKL